jgi:superfamily II DNA/RNA helicase
VIHKFREGIFNTLVATCVGEEGLDVGECDLIVLFDTSSSPIRTVQRMGRTGRKVLRYRVDKHRVRKIETEKGTEEFFTVFFLETRKMCCVGDRGTRRSSL